jgi:hypothetical protein
MTMSFVRFRPVARWAVAIALSAAMVFLPVVGGATAGANENVSVTVEITQDAECDPALQVCDRDDQEPSAEIPRTGLLLPWIVPVAAVMTLVAGGVLSHRSRHAR